VNVNRRDRIARATGGFLRFSVDAVRACPLHFDSSRPVSANSGHSAKTGERVKSDPNRKLPFFPQPTAIGRKAVICCIAGRNPTVSLRLRNSVKVEGSHDPM
jgi:hypothetical protein